MIGILFFFQAEDGIRYLVRSRGLGDVYKRQGSGLLTYSNDSIFSVFDLRSNDLDLLHTWKAPGPCLLYTSDAADERSSVDLGGRRIIKKKNNKDSDRYRTDSVKKSNSVNAENMSENTPTIG